MQIQLIALFEPFEACDRARAQAEFRRVASELGAEVFGDAAILPECFGLRDDDLAADFHDVQTHGRVQIATAVLRRPPA